MATRDYKKRAPAPKKKKSAPGWVWLLAGLGVGLFVAFLVYLNKLPTLKHATRQVQSAPAKPAAQDARSVKKDTPAKAPDAQAKEHKGIAYDFYTILPEMEVPVPDNDASSRGLPPTPVDPGTYILQVGSFRSNKEADTRKAELALLGIVSSIQSVTINGSDTWHRVRIGPVSDMKKLDELRSKLKQNNIHFMLLREKS